MEKTIAIGLVLAILTLACCGLILATNHVKIIKKFFNNYWFYAITSVIALGYFIGLRWIWDLQDWINGDGTNYVGGLDVVISKVLLLDMCPFLAVTMPIWLLIDRRRQYVGCLAWFAIVGAGVTIFGQIMFEKVGPNGNSHLQNVSWWEYIFFNKLYFIMHFYIFIMATIVLLNSPNFDWKRIVVSHGFALLFFSYISTMVAIFKIKYNATGIVENDWKPGGQYQVIGSWFDWKWPAVPIVVFSFVWIVILLMMLIRNTLSLDEHFDVAQSFKIKAIQIGLKKWLAKKQRL